MALDFRSDTITLPTDEMRRAMAQAQVGDDVSHEDPTVIELEQLAAQKLGKQAGLFVASGTMGNLVSVLTHTNHTRGVEIICESRSHILLNEVGGACALGGVQIRSVDGVRGAMPLNAVRSAIRGENIHFPKTALVCVETTHNFAGGVPLPLDHLAGIRALADEHSLKVHMDGARLFNAAAAQRVSASEIAQHADSVSICLSKGLSAPIGAVIVGNSDFIANARRYRKMLGGGMRQVGVIAAAGLVALNSMVDRLTEDHANAMKLAEGLANISGLEIDPKEVETNIVIFSVERSGMDASQYAEKLSQSGVLASVIGKYEVRLVTHRHISAQDVDQALDIISKL